MAVEKEVQVVEHPSKGKSGRFTTIIFHTCEPWKCMSI